MSVVNPLIFKIRDRDFLIRRTKFSLGANFHSHTSIFLFEGVGKGISVLARSFIFNFRDHDFLIRFIEFGFNINFR